eukprot:m.106295 g.106295  ORF g.106295 m.106295 type:complete len:93 (-) comp15297_c0_seq1:1079-1357(-)
MIRQLLLSTLLLRYHASPKAKARGGNRDTKSSSNGRPSSRPKQLLGTRLLLQLTMKQLNSCKPLQSSSSQSAVAVIILDPHGPFDQSAVTNS